MAKSPVQPSEKKPVGPKQKQKVGPKEFKGADAPIEVK